MPIVDSNPLLIENREPPFGTQLHVFNLPPGSSVGMGDHAHQSTARNGWIAREEADGTPSDILVGAWSSVLGDDTDGDAITNTSDNCPGTPNGGQADADADDIGDACDPTPQGTTPPTIAVFGHITVNATGPAGATVSFLVTATDDLPPVPTPPAQAAEWTADANRIRAVLAC
jgi:Thrombospondin type 3 repeat